MGKPTFFALVLAVTLSAVPMAIASQPADRGDTPGLGWGPGGSHGGTMVAAPGPVAGIGLPILAVAGGFIWIKSRKRRSDRLDG